MKRYAWRPDCPDCRDLIHTPEKKLSVPDKVDLRGGFAPCYDQGSLGSCTANAIGSLVQYCRKKQEEQAFMPSRLFIYWNERSMERTVEYDAGARIRDGMKVINKFGVCPEVAWPYDTKRFTQKPSDQAFKQALDCQSVKYARVNRADWMSIVHTLANGNPIVFGFTVYESFESDAVAKTGMVPMPDPSEKALGGHAVALVGYDRTKKLFIVRNSWGPKWGDGGYCYMPWDYITRSNLSSDFWTLFLVE